MLNKEKKVQPTSKSGNDAKPIVTRSQFLVSNDVYEEQALGKWCYKFQPKGQPVIIVTHDDKETAAELMIKELKLAGIDFV